MARGFTQIYSVNYYETYLPVARLASFQLLMAIAAWNSWPVDALDFKSAFWNSKLGDDEVIYLEQPAGYKTKDREGWVSMLLKALYGLKQGLKKLYDVLYQALKELGFIRSEANYSMFFKQIGKHIVIVVIHVGDRMVTGNSTLLIKKFKEDMNMKYKLANLGPVNWLLEIKVTQDLANKKISLSQKQYIEAIITRFNFDDLKACLTPLEPSAPLSVTYKIRRHS